MWRPVPVLDSSAMFSPHHPHLYSRVIIDSCVLLLKDDASDTGREETSEAGQESKEESSSSSPKEFEGKDLLHGYEEKVVRHLIDLLPLYMGS